MQTHEKTRADAIGITRVQSKEANMDKQKKPRICEVLGVEVGEEFSTASTFRMMYHITEAGAFLDSAGNYPNAHVVCGLISHPDHIIHKPRFTKQEVEATKAIRILFPCATHLIQFQPNEPVSVKAGDAFVVNLNRTLFPSVQPCQSYALDEIIGGAE